ncbi:hypothetical protein TKK_0005914 [Trichogramma kaykai]
MESREDTVIVKMEPSDTLPDSGHNYILDLVDSCKTENFETLSLNKLSNKTNEKIFIDFECKNMKPKLKYNFALRLLM